MTNEWNIFLIAVMFYTRIPIPFSVNHSQAMLDESSRYFPFIGWIVGGLSALVFVLAYKIFPLQVALIISMISSIMITGAFHEDGFADVCDGFGGGMKSQDILTIMKDSRIGTYGTIGLIFILLFKYILLLEMSPQWIPFVLIAAHSTSRFAANIFKYTHNYVKENEDSKAKPMSKRISPMNLGVSALFGLLPLLLFKQFSIILVPLSMLCVLLLLSRYFQQRIGGFTGDCLGATQQVCEIIFYLSYLAWTFI